MGPAELKFEVKYIQQPAYQPAAYSLVMIAYAMPNHEVHLSGMYMHYHLSEKLSWQDNIEK